MQLLHHYILLNIFLSFFIISVCILELLWSSNLKEGRRREMPQHLDLWHRDRVHWQSLFTEAHAWDPLAFYVSAVMLMPIHFLWIASNHCWRPCKAFWVGVAAVWAAPAHPKVDRDSTLCKLTRQTRGHYPMRSKLGGGLSWRFIYFPSMEQHGNGR